MYKKLTWVSLLLSWPLCSYSANLTEMNFQWLMKNQTKVEKILSSDNPSDAIPVINTLGTLWKYKDGAIWVEVAPSIATALMFHNQSMLTWFSKHPQAWQEWLSDFPTALFTNWSGNSSETKQLEALREQMLSHFKQYSQSGTDPGLVEMNRALYRRLLESEIREID